MTTFDAAAWLFVLAAAIGVANDRWFHLPRNIALLLGSLCMASGVMAVDTWLIQGKSVAYWRNRIEHANLSGVLLDGVLALLLFRRDRTLVLAHGFSFDGATGSGASAG